MIGLRKHHSSWRNQQEKPRRWKAKIILIINSPCESHVVSSIFTPISSDARPHWRATGTCDSICKFRIYHDTLTSITIHTALTIKICRKRQYRLPTSTAPGILSQNHQMQASLQSTVTKINADGQSYNQYNLKIKRSSNPPKEWKCSVIVSELVSYL